MKSPTCVVLGCPPSSCGKQCDPYEREYRPRVYVANPFQWPTASMAKAGHTLLGRHLPSTNPHMAHHRCHMVPNRQETPTWLAMRNGLPNRELLMGCHGQRTLVMACHRRGYVPHQEVVCPSPYCCILFTLMSNPPAYGTRSRPSSKYSIAI
jgi:hypothetical protein